MRRALTGEKKADRQKEVFYETLGGLRNRWYRQLGVGVYEWLWGVWIRLRGGGYNKQLATTEFACNCSSTCTYM